jgi:hypothetical protein
LISQHNSPSLAPSLSSIKALKLVDIELQSQLAWETGRAWILALRIFGTMIFIINQSREVPEMTELRSSLSAVCAMGMSMASMERML